MTTVELEHFPELGESGLAPKLLIYLQFLRYLSAVPIHVTSALRPADHQSAHSQAVALDISDNPYGNPISSHWRHLIIRSLYAMGLQRVGIYDRHIHFDLADIRWPQEVTWIGVSS